MLTGLHCSRSLLMMLFRAKGAGKEGHITHGKQKENLEKYKQTWIRGVLNNNAWWGKTLIPQTFCWGFGVAVKFKTKE